MKTLPLLVLCLLTYFIYTQSCNEGLCASLVSKCLLTKSCECDMSDKKNCTCCKDCHLCLSKLYIECCSCVGMCPKPIPSISQTASTIEDLSEPIPDLFDVLTEETDPVGRWSVFKYPSLYDPRFVNNGHSLNVFTIDNEGVQQFGTSDNCTVAYMSQCFSLSKCKEACMSMGASRMRWFHEEGCCQCVSHTCLDYGLNKPKCMQCPEQLENNTGSQNGKLNSGPNSPAMEIVDLERGVEKMGIVDEHTQGENPTNV